MGAPRAAQRISTGSMRPRFRHSMETLGTTRPLSTISLSREQMSPATYTARSIQTTSGHLLPNSSSSMGQVVCCNADSIGGGFIIFDLNDNGVFVGGGYPFASNSFDSNEIDGLPAVTASSAALLNSLGWLQTGDFYFIGIDNRNNILAFDGNGDYYKFTPVPEPSSIISALSWLAAIFAVTYAVPRRAADPTSTGTSGSYV